jgi:DNA-binding response OmpR family regulator
MSAGDALPDQQPTLLVVDDEPAVRRVLAMRLQLAGYNVVCAEDGEQALELFNQEQPDLVVLDVMLPKLDGFAVCRRLRAESAVPIIFLSALDAIAEKVAGLDIGADDYLSKPFEPKELSLRIASILRRTQAQPQRPETTFVQVVRFGDFVFDVDRAELRQGDEVLKLTDRERFMLKLLAQTPGEAVSREALAGDVAPGNERTIDVQMNRLRRKIERDPADPFYLQTARGAGYRLVVDR